MSPNYYAEQDIAKSYRLLNIGATTLIGASYEGDLDYMAAAWAGVCDFDKGYAIIAKDHYILARLPGEERERRFDLDVFHVLGAQGDPQIYQPYKQVTGQLFRPRQRVLDHISHNYLDEYHDRHYG